MNHTKGKASLNIHNSARYYGDMEIDLGNNYVKTIAVFLNYASPEENKANAERVVQCWNLFDEVQSNLNYAVDKLEKIEAENEQLKTARSESMQHIANLNGEITELKEQKQRNNVSVEMLIEALKPFAEMCGEISSTKIKQGGTVFQYNDKHITVADFEKAEQIINYLSHHPIK